MLKVGINAHLLSGQDGYRRAGIHHYISQILRHLPPDPDWRYTVFAQDGEDLPHPPAHLDFRTTQWPTAQRLARIVWEQTAWPWHASREKLDLIHSMAFVLPRWQPCPGVVTIYDLSFVTHPDRFPRLQRAYLTAQTRHACRHARRLVAISESSRQDLHHHFSVPLEKIDLVYPGVDDSFAPLPPEEVAHFRQRQGLSGRVILHVGTLQPRKNIPMLLEAFAVLKQQAGFDDVSLVLVGGKGWFYDEIYARVENLGLASQVCFTGYVPDNDLTYWYNLAAVLVFPSVYEGFGLPVLEAMACGVPVVAANTSSVPEVLGQAGLLFEPSDITALVDHLIGVLQDRDKMDRLIAAGREQARQFRWERSGQQMQEVYQRALQNH